MAGKKQILANFAGKQHPVSWFPGSSDGAILKTIALAVGLPLNADVVVKDPADGCVVVVSDALPDGLELTVEVVRYGAVGVPATSSAIAVAPVASGADGNKGFGLAGDRQTQQEGQEFRGQLLKFERINAHLANERTWLAWVRTALSVLTVALSFISLTDDLSGKLQSLGTAVGITFVACALLTYFTGWVRYTRVKEVLTWRGEQIKSKFGRFSLGWQAKLLAAVLVVSVPLYIVGAVSTLTSSR
ncbi:unnamed protein product [Phaeothamnion confervicola]